MDTNTHPFRSAYVWILILIPAVSVVMGGIMLWLAISSFDGMVDDDYYQRGLQINQDLNRDSVALKAGIKGRLTTDLTSTQLHLQRDDPGFKLQTDLQLTVSNATRVGLDQSVQLHKDPQGRYRGKPVVLSPGHWYLQISGPDWRIKGSIRVEDSAELIDTQLMAVRAGS